MPSFLKPTEESRRLVFPEGDREELARKRTEFGGDAIIGPELSR